MNEAPDVHTMLDQLTRNHPNRQPYIVEREFPAGSGRWMPDGERHHTNWAPSLVAQLIQSTGDTNGGGSEKGSAAVSKPAARIESLDTLMLIDDQAGEWIDRLGGVIPADPIDGGRALQTVAGAGTILRLRRLNGLYRSTQDCRQAHKRDEAKVWCCERGRLEAAIRSWWHQARIITGWDTAATRFYNTCPMCDYRGGLRIRLDGALCVECREVWTPETMGHLADHIRAENKDEGRDASPMAPEDVERTESCA